MKRPKTFAFRFGAILLSLIVIEIGLQAVRFIANYKDRLSGNKKLSLSIYKDKAWAKTLFQEYHDIQALDFDQYVGWKTRTYHGQFINIGQDGTRKTFNPILANDKKRDSIYVFGGSSIWGAGVRDDHTIPSYLSKISMHNGNHFIVKNYGERGYTFTQEIIRLILLLREGHRPRMVIFYDGVNDVITAYHNGQAGIIGLTPELKSLVEWKRLSLLKQFWTLARDFIANHLMIYKTIDKLPSLFARSYPSSFAATKYDESELEQLTQDILTHYLASLNLVDKLSQAYGFHYLCFWQPVIYTKDHLTPEEENADPLTRDLQLRKLYYNTYAAIKKFSLPPFHNLSDVFKNHDSILYFDFCHLSEEGNEMIANEMFKIMSESVQKQLPTQPAIQMQ